MEYTYYLVSEGRRRPSRPKSTMRSLSQSLFFCELSFFQPFSLSLSRSLTLTAECRFFGVEGLNWVKGASHSWRPHIFLIFIPSPLCMYYLSTILGYFIKPLSYSMQTYYLEALLAWASCLSLSLTMNTIHSLGSGYMVHGFVSKMTHVGGKNHISERIVGENVFLKTM